jgi:glucose/arabinose dehydrogenase
MRLGVWGWAVLAVSLILGIAAWVVVRPRIGGPAVLSSIAEADARAAAAPRIRFEVIASGFKEPVGMEFVPGHPRQAMILEKGGHARLLELPEQPGAEAKPGPEVLAVTVHSHSELGLLGWAFHPHYPENGLVYIDDNPKDEGPLRTRISEWYLPPDQIGKRTAELKRVLLEINQPYPNHDGGQVVFGPDGYLYIAMGDGGFRADPQGNGQNLESLLGKILRIDVNGQPYAIPPDNPFAQRAGARPEIWAYGMRNPWRFSFDPKGRLIAADVGQDLYEEVDIVAAGDNQGWNVHEAFHCFAPSSGCPTQGFVDPIFEYGHDIGNSITGGFVYLGSAIPWLRNQYVFADYVTGRFWALELPEKRERRVAADFLGRFEHAFSSFARDANGEIYALDFARGLILRLTAA